MVAFFTKYIVFLTMLLTSIMAQNITMSPPVGNITSIVTATATATAIQTDSNGLVSKPAGTPGPDTNDDESAGVGTPTSTTTSLSALSTTAIKDGHRGHLPQQGGPFTRGHAHNPSTTSLEAERADRISRLAGLERVSTLRQLPQQHLQNQNQQQSPHSQGGASPSPQTTPTSTGFPAHYVPQNNHPLTPAYFDSNGQPTAVTKMSTVGTASATESHVGDVEERDGGSRTTAGERDEDMLSTDTNYRDPPDSVASMGADPDAMDEDMDGLGTRSVGGYEDRMSDDGSASLVGFGEGAGSTVSGPIYHRRPIPGSTTTTQQFSMLERTNSGLSDVRARERDTPMAGELSHTLRDEIAPDGLGDASMATRPGGVTQQQPTREAAERIVQTLDSGETDSGPSALGSPGRGGELGKFYFEEGKDR
ncbi:hypothetical protein LIA77_06399 [Sarocladium implicatum]|nr:hypothetical protein LIA77_06399 [Sarocladium implicatum]